MNVTIYSKDKCPWCEKAIALAEKLGATLNVVKVSSVEALQGIFPDAKTVPQIILDGQHIGGYTDFEALTSKPKARTVFNTDNTGHEQGKYPLFFGESLGFVDTINSPYPILDKLYQKQMSQIWNEFEIDLTQDRIDMVNAPGGIVSLMRKTILWQHLADSVASRSISGAILQFVSNSDLEAWYNAVAVFETIHARTYSHIIKQTFVDPVEALREGYADLDVIKRSEVLRNCFDRLVNTAYDAPLEEREIALYSALMALYMLEAVNFMASFAITFGIAETAIFQGISQNVVLICRDEMLHAQGGKEILSILKTSNPRVFAKVVPEMQSIFNSIVEQELEWTDYLFSDGRYCPGLTANRVKDYVRFRANDVATVFGWDTFDITENPLPYMDNYIDTSKVQVAAQELQLTSYLVNAVEGLTDRPATMETLRKKYITSI